MSNVISGGLAGCYSPMGKTFVLVDESGAELTGVVVDQETVFTATDNDVRAGSVYAGDLGVSTGTKDIPSYYTSEGTKIVPVGSDCIIYIPHYDYTKLQAIICTYNTSLSDSVCSEQVAINSGLYTVQSTTLISNIVVDNENNSINFGITNTFDKPVIIRYFTYKEIY